MGDNSRCAHFALDRVSSDDYSAVWVTSGSLLGVNLFVIMKMTLGSDESPVLGDFWFWARCRKIHLVEPQLIYQWFLAWALMIFATGGLDSNSILVMKRTMLLISSQNKQIGFLDDALSQDNSANEESLNGSCLGGSCFFYCIFWAMLSHLSVIKEFPQCFGTPEIHIFSHDFLL